MSATASATDGPRYWSASRISTYSPRLADGSVPLRRSLGARREEAVGQSSQISAVPSVEASTITSSTGEYVCART